MSKKIMEKDGQTVHVDFESGSVAIMEDLGWKVTGDAPPEPNEKPASAPAGLLPSFFRTAAFLEQALAGLPSEIKDVDAVVNDLKTSFGDLITPEVEASVRTRAGDSTADLGDNTGVDPKYHATPVAQVKELLDAKGLKYSDSATKAEMVNILIESGKPKAGTRK